MSNNRRFVPAWLVKASAWFLRQPGATDLVVLVTAIILLSLGGLV